MVLLFVFFVPPFQKPDEPTHFYKIVAMSQGQWFCRGGTSPKYVKIPKLLYDFPVQLQANALAFDSNLRFPLKLLFMPYPIHSPASKSQSVKDTCSLGVFGYIPMALVMTITNLFNNALFSFYVARLTATAIFLFALIYSFRLTPKEFRPLLLLTAALPLTIHQATSISYDSLQISLSFLIFACLTHILTNNRDHIINKVIVMQFAIFLLNLTRPGYYSLLLLWFIIPKSKLGLTTKNYLKLTFIIFVTIITALMFYSLYLKSVISTVPPNALISSPIQLTVLLHHPTSFLHAFVNTFSQARYLAQLIGVFGWVNLVPNQYLFYLFVAVMALVAAKVFRDTNLILPKPFQLFILFISIFGVVFVLSVIMFLNWTPIGYPEIDGLAGRYFITLFPFILLLIISSLKFLQAKKSLYILYYGIVLIICLMIFSAYKYRFYDTSIIHVAPSVDLIPNSSGSAATINVSKQPVKTSLLSQTATINGFIFYRTPTDRPINALFSYSIKNSACEQTLQQGFLNTISLNRSESYLESFTPLQIPDKKVCFIMETIKQNNGSDLNLLLNRLNQPVILLNPPD
jgi:uncharacterized membrane protein